MGRIIDVSLDGPLAVTVVFARPDDLRCIADAGLRCRHRSSAWAPADKQLLGRVPHGHSPRVRPMSSQRTYGSCGLSRSANRSDTKAPRAGTFCMVAE